MKVILTTEDGDSADDVDFDAFDFVGVPGDGDGEDPPPGGFLGSIITVNVLVGSGGIGGTALTEMTPPVTQLGTGNQFRIKVTALNESGGAEKLGLHYVITRPDGSIIERVEFEAWPYTGEGDEHTFIEPGIDIISIDQIDDWTLVVELLGGTVDNVLDSESITLFTGVTEETNLGFGTIGQMIPMLIMVMMMKMMMELMEDPVGVTIQVVEGAEKVYSAVKTKGASLFG